MGKQWKQWQIFFSWTPKSLQTVTAAVKLKDACSVEEKTMISLNSILKMRYITLPTEVYLVKTMVFLVVMYECESWTIKKAEHQRIDAFKLRCWKRLWSPLDYKEIQPVHPKGNLSWIFFGRTDAEAETPMLWPLDGKNWLIGKNPDAGTDWMQEEKGPTEDEMVLSHHGLNGHKFE